MMKKALMRKISFFILLPMLFIFSLSGCANQEVIKDEPIIDNDITNKEYNEDNIAYTIAKDTIWTGKVTVDGIVKIAKGAKLTISPGSTIEFTFHDYDKDGLGDSGLVIEGGIVAKGEYDRPILFTAVDGHKESGAWGMLLVNFSNDVIFDYCRFEYSNFTLHLHFSTGSITNSYFTNNEDGTRIGRSRFFIYNNVFKGNRVKGMNFTDSKNYIKYNTITENKHGVFLFEQDKKSAISYNNIMNNSIYNLKLGDFFVGDVDLSDNYWGDLTGEEANKKIYDKKFDDTLGVVSILPLPEPVADAGIIKDIEITNLFEFKTDGFIDSSPIADEGSRTIYFGSFDHNFYALDADTGAMKFKFDTGDVIDSSPVIYNENVFFASWNSIVYALDKNSGVKKWEFQMQKSEQDDHRQSSPVVKDGVLYIGGYDGTVYALRCDSGDLIWKFKTGGAIRTRGVIMEDELVFGSTDGKLYGLSPKTGRGLWMIDLKSPILATPLYSGNVIIVAAKDGIIYEIDAKNKAVSNRFINGSVNFYSSPIKYKGDVAFATTDNKLFWLKKYGLNVKGVSDIRGPAYATPVVYKDFLLVPTNIGELIIIERGCAMRPIKEFRAGDAIQSTPLIFDDKIYFGARDNKLYSIKIDVIAVDAFGSGSSGSSRYYNK